MNSFNAMLFNALPHADEVIELSSDDRLCFVELRDVLARHGKLDRFGLTLLHKHFDLLEDEVLIETTDEVSRIQTIVPKKIAEIDKTGDKLLETAWSLENTDAVSRCERKCVYQGGSHRPHVHVFM